MSSAVIKLMYTCTDEIHPARRRIDIADSLLSDPISKPTLNEAIINIQMYMHTDISSISRGGDVGTQMSLVT